MEKMDKIDEFIKQLSLYEPKTNIPQNVYHSINQYLLNHNIPHQDVSPFIIRRILKQCQLCYYYEDIPTIYKEITQNIKN